jgi:hypothetical protein
LLFPDGNFAPSWTRWLIPLAVLGAISAFLPTGVRVFVLLVVLCAVVAAQVSRFRSVSSWAQREQTKWALFGVAAAIAGFAAIALGLVLLPAAQTGHRGLFTSFANSTGLALASSAIPITIGIAVLRYHLWDINRIISLTLVYTTLTVILGALYIGGVIGLQRLFQVFAHNSSSVAIALSTLATAALFGPLTKTADSNRDRPPVLPRQVRRRQNACRLWRPLAR